MSDVLIKGFKMPRACSFCPFSRQESFEDKPHCVILGEYLYNDTLYTKSPKCPLVEVKPHGKLMDADADNSSAGGERMTKQEMKIVEEAIETSRQSIKAYLDLNLRLTDKERNGLGYILDYQARCAVDEIKRRVSPAEAKNVTADMQTWVEWNDHFPM